MSIETMGEVRVREELRPMQHPGLITLVSADTRPDRSGKQAAEIAIDYHLNQLAIAPPPSPPTQVKGIPPDLYQRLNTVLLPTGCFDNERVLRGYFIDDRISPWRYCLPEATTSKSRMMGTLSFLYEQFAFDRSYEEGESNALVLFLRVLSDNLEPGDIRHQAIIDLANALAAIAIPSPVSGAPLRCCWLIASASGSLPQAQDIKKRRELADLTIKIREVYDEFGVQETYGLVRRIYENEISQVGLRVQDVIADFTGGTKPMSTGMLLACTQLNAPLQYMYGDRIGRVASVPRRIDFVAETKQGNV